jgi:shikimate dehydrogenase
MKVTAPAPRDCAKLLAAVPAAALHAGLVGRAIQESLTPGMHEAEGRRLGLDYVYSLIDFDRLQLADSELAPIVEAAAEAGFAGLNVTHPFKQAVLPLLDAMAPEAAAIGAVNTVVFQAGRRVGHNTDAWGFAESFRRAMEGAALASVALVGAGGAGLAVAHALLTLGAERIDVFDREEARAEALVGRLAAPGLCARRLGELAPTLRAASGLVNATPAGMSKYPGLPVPAAALHDGLWVADVVYFPEQTALIQAAAARGCRTLTGRGMAIFQAVRAFELFTGRAPDPAAMARHFQALQA